MIMFYGLVKNESETGYWVGFLGGSIMFGRFLSAPAWGWLCDHWGRRPTLLTGIVTTSLLAVLFGLSTTFYWAIAFRFLQGLLSPIAVVTRTVISELYQAKDQASAMSWYVMMGSLGNITGNAVGGFFAYTKGSSIQLLNDHPFLLPNFLIAFAGLISFILCFCLLPETKTQESLLGPTRSRNFIQIIKDKKVIQVTLLYIICFSNKTGFGELIVLWEWAKLKNGGFQFTTEEIGSLSAITSLVFILYINILFRFMTDKYGVTKVTSRSLFFNIPALLLFPLLSYSNNTEYLKYILIVLCSLFYYSIEFMSLTSSLILINNSVLSSERGKVNGYTLAISNLARGSSAPIFGSIFAKTATSSYPYPFNFAFAYIVLAVCVYIAWRISKNLDSSLNHPKSESKIEIKEIGQEMANIEDQN
jgi:MFS family permease